MANITGHWWLILALLIIVLIIWGPGKLPDIGAGMGRAIREFRKASSETKETIVNATASPASSSNSTQSSAEATPVAAAPAGAAQHEEQKS